MPSRTRSKTKRQRTSSMDAKDTTLLLNDFVSLPIIISDYDATVANERRESGSISKESITAADSTTTSESNSSAAPKAKWNTGFSEFADDLWSRMTGGMKQKLREACIEVLKRTDDAKEQHGDRWDDHDDNAKLLD
jgi:hypothetical protein